METTHKKIKRLRESYNYTQEYMAHELGISQPAYAKIECGDTQLNIKKLVRLAEILQVDPQELLESSRTFNLFNNKNAYGFVENLYHDNKKVYKKIIDQLERENLRLEKEVERLRKRIDGGA